MATYVVLPWLLSPRRMRESGNGHGLFVFERPLRSPWKHVKEPPRALWIAARAPKFLYHMSIRDKKNSYFYVHFKMDWQFQLVSNKDKQVQINYFLRTYFSERYLQDWRHDSSEIEAAEIMAKLRWMKSKQQPCLVLLSFFYFGNVS